MDLPHEKDNSGTSSEHETSEVAEADTDQALPSEKLRKKHFMNLYFASNKNDRSCARFRKVSVKTDDISDIFGEEILCI